MTEIDCWDLDGRLTIELDRVATNLEITWWNGDAVQLTRDQANELMTALARFLQGGEL